MSHALFGGTRSKIETYVDVIKALKEDEEITYRMNKSNVSYKQFIKNVHDMAKCGLVKIEEEKIYNITDKGEEFLKKAVGLLSLLR